MDPLDFTDRHQKVSLIFGRRSRDILTLLNWIDDGTARNERIRSRILALVEATGTPIGAAPHEVSQRVACSQ